MRESQEREIDGRTYKVQPLAGRLGVKFLARLGRLLGPSLTSLMGAAAKSGGDIMKADIGLLALAVPALVDRLTDKELDEVMATLLGSAFVDGKELWSGGKAFDVEMAGATASIFKLLGFALEVNYGELFAGLRVSSASATESHQAPSTSPST